MLGSVGAEKDKEGDGTARHQHQQKQEGPVDLRGGEEWQERWHMERSSSLLGPTDIMAAWRGAGGRACEQAARPAQPAGKLACRVLRWACAELGAGVNW